MVGNTSNLITSRLVRSKLRKRDESSATIVSPNSNEQQTNGVNQQQMRSSNSHSIIVEQRQQQLQQTTKLQAAYNSASVLESGTYHTNNGVSTDKHQVSFVRTSGVGKTTTDTSNWVFPPKEPSPNIYHCFTTDALVVNESNGFKGFRKQFSGRFKRLVARKPNTPAPAIPPELKPQLKSIYVY